MQRLGDRVVATADLVARVGAAWRLRPAPWVDLGGSWTTNVRIEPDGAPPVVARLHRPGVPVERVVAQQAARVVLVAAGLPAVRPLPGPDGATVVVVDGAAVEVEPLVSWTRSMRTAALLEPGCALLGRVHDALHDAVLPAAAAEAPWVNWIAAGRAAAATRRGAERLRGTGAGDLADLADRAVAHVDAVAALEASCTGEVVQPVHGDFWDDNVGFVDTATGPRVAALLDLGFLGVRPRLDDLALPVWFWLLEPEQRRADQGELATSVARWLDAYDRGTRRPLGAAERAALPLAVARQPAWSVGGWVAALDEADAVRHARRCVGQLPVAEAVLAHLDRWQQTLTG